MEIRQLVVAGESLRVGVQCGAGTPLIICNELGANLELMRPLVDALPDAEIVVFDYPGSGQSSQKQGLRRMASYASLLHGLIDALGYNNQPVDVLGAGWGGLLAQKFAYDFPERARRLILVSTSLGQVMFPGKLKNILQLATPARFASARRYTKIAQRVYGGRVKIEPALISENAKSSILPSKRGYFSQLLAVAGFSSLFWLHRVYQPTLILAGDDDQIVPLVNSRLLNLLMPRSRMHVIQGGGHLLLVTRVDEAARHIGNFLRRKDARHELPTKETI